MIKKILEVNPQNRITVEEIKNHEFYILGQDILKKREFVVDKYKITSLVIDKMIKMGFNKQDILDNLAENNHTNTTTTFHLLYNKQKKEMYYQNADFRSNDGEKIVRIKGNSHNAYTAISNKLTDKTIDLFGKENFVTIQEEVSTERRDRRERSEKGSGKEKNGENIFLKKIDNKFEITNNSNLNGNYGGSKHGKKISIDVGEKYQKNNHKEILFGEKKLTNLEKKSQNSKNNQDNYLVTEVVPERCKVIKIEPYINTFNTIEADKDLILNKENKNKFHYNSIGNKQKTIILKANNLSIGSKNELKNLLEKKININYKKDERHCLTLINNPAINLNDEVIF